MSDIEMKVKEATKDVCDQMEELISCVKHDVGNGICNVDTEELGKVIDMIKDLAESKEKIIKAMYYEQIMVAMVQ